MTDKGNTSIATGVQNGMAFFDRRIAVMADK